MHYIYDSFNPENTDDQKEFYFIISNTAELLKLQAKYVLKEIKRRKVYFGLCTQREKNLLNILLMTYFLVPYTKVASFLLSSLPTLHI